MTVRFIIEFADDTDPLKFTITREPEAGGWGQLEYALNWFRHDMDAQLIAHYVRQNWRTSIQTIIAKVIDDAESREIQGKAEEAELGRGLADMLRAVLDQQI